MCFMQDEYARFTLDRYSTACFVVYKKVVAIGDKFGSPMGRP